MKLHVATLMLLKHCKDKASMSDQLIRNQQVSGSSPLIGSRIQGVTVMPWPLFCCKLPPITTKRGIVEGKEVGMNYCEDCKWFKGPMLLFWAKEFGKCLHPNAQITDNGYVSPKYGPYASNERSIGKCGAAAINFEAKMTYAEFKELTKT
jgi:hypothetical protein